MWNFLEKKERSDLKKKQKNKCQSVDRPRTTQHNLIESKSTQENLIEDKSINPSIGTEYRNLIAENIHLDWLKDAASTHGEKRFS